MNTTMEWTDPIHINGKDYKFEHVEDEPLMMVMKIDDSYSIWRDINCDTPMERWALVKTYDSVKNSIVKKNDTYRQDVYHGKNIKSPEFIKTLLEHVLHGIIDEWTY